MCVKVRDVTIHCTSDTKRFTILNSRYWIHDGDVFFMNENKKLTTSSDFDKDKFPLTISV